VQLISYNVDYWHLYKPSFWLWNMFLSSSICSDCWKCEWSNNTAIHPRTRREWQI